MDTHNTNTGNIPQELKDIPNWTLSLKEGATEKEMKAPINPRTGHKASTNDPNTWCDYKLAIDSMAKHKCHGIEFILTRDTKNVFYFCVDLDHCIDTHGNLSRTAAEVKSHFPNTYTELSQSKNGLHILGRINFARSARYMPGTNDTLTWQMETQNNALPPSNNAFLGHVPGVPCKILNLRKNISTESNSNIEPIKSHLGTWQPWQMMLEEKGKTKVTPSKNPQIDCPIEVFWNHQAVLLTGNLYKTSTSTIEDCQDGFIWLFEKYLIPEGSKVSPTSNSTLTSASVVYSPMSSIDSTATITSDTTIFSTDNYTDDEVIEIALNAANADKFKILFYNGDISEYKGDDSSADAALCCLLAFYTNGNYNQIERIFGRSALGNRDKWAKEEHYRKLTIDYAIKETTQHYPPKAEQSKLKWASVLNYPRNYVEHWIKRHNIRIDNVGCVWEGGKRASANTVKMLICDYDEDSRKYRLARKKGDPFLLTIHDNRFRDIFQEFITIEMKKKKDEINTVLKYTVEVDDIEIKRYIQAITGQQLSTDIAILKHFIWQVKRKLNDKSVSNHIMPILFGRSGNGKSVAVKKLISPFEGFGILNSSISQSVDERAQMGFSEYYICNLDEMEYTGRLNAESFKRVITGDTMSIRILATHNLNHVSQNLTFIGSSNKPVSEILKDTTSNRRFWEFQCVAEKLDHETINTIDYVRMWKCVDESLEEGYLSGDVLQEIKCAQKETLIKSEFAELLESYEMAGEVKHEGRLDDIDREDLIKFIIYESNRKQFKVKLSGPQIIKKLKTPNLEYQPSYDFNETSTRSNNRRQHRIKVPHGLAQLIDQTRVITDCWQKGF